METKFVREIKSILLVLENKGLSELLFYVFFFLIPLLSLPINV